MNHVIDEKERERQDQIDDRWSALGRQSGILKIYKQLPAEELKKFDIFQGFDDRLLEKMSPDISVAVWDKQKTLFEEGSYIDLAFYIVKGHINVYLQKLQKQNSFAQPIFGNKQIFKVNGANGTSFRQNQDKTVFASRVNELKKRRDRVFLTSMDVDLPWGDVLNLSEGDIFGEIGASIGWPQSATAQTTSECLLVQIRLPALEKMKRRSKAFKARIDKIYIERSLTSQLKSYPFFQQCSDEDLEELKERVELHSFQSDELIAKEGDAANAVYLLRSGFVKLLQKVGDGEIVVYYLSKGMMLGDIELLLKQARWLFTAISVENTELVKITQADFKKIIEDYPDLQRPLWDASALRVKESGANKRNIGKSEFIDTALASGLVEGNSVLVIDLDTCTRCDDCVRGCTDSHGGAPKFVREGEKYSDFLITRACYHCQDPVCLIGCPTGAIRRAGIGDVVEIDDELCIGCKVCFNNCPYNAITMVERTNGSGKLARIGKKGEEKTLELASKCDLCQSTGHEPACVSNCPHGCAVRISDTEDFARLLFRTQKDSRSHNGFRIRKVLQSFQWLYFFLAILALSIVTYTVNATVFEISSGNVWGLSYGTAALVLMIGTSLYGVRRRLAGVASRLRLGSAFHWLQFHLYGGALFAVFVLMHTGFKIPTGALYQWLWAISMWVTISGFAGVLFQKWVPTMLSSALSVEVIYERIPELIRDIRKNADELAKQCSEPIKNFYLRHIASSLGKPKPRPIYFVDITGGIQRRLKQFEFLKRVLSDEENQRLAKLELLYKSKLEMDAHYTLQKLLRWWLYIHLPASILLLVLVAIHLYAVFYY